MPPGDASTPAFDEWRRALGKGGERHAYLPTAAQAVAELIDAGRPGDAEHLARQVVAITRSRATKLPESMASLRDLPIALDNVGRSAEAQGAWSEAAAVYGESLSIRRQLALRLGGTPESLRDLSVSLDNVGRSAQAQGAWSEAAAAYGESLSISRQLVERLGGSPESLEDLAISLLNIASVPGRDPTSSRAEAIAIYRRLASRHPDVAHYRERLATFGDDNGAGSSSSDHSPA